MKDVINLSSGFLVWQISLICSEKAFDKFVKKNGIIGAERDDYNSCMGVFRGIGDHRFMLIYCPHEKGLVDLVHELSHAVDEIFLRTGVNTGIESTETRAYLLDSLFAQALDGGYGK